MSGRFSLAGVFGKAIAWSKTEKGISTCKKIFSIGKGIGVGIAGLSELGSVYTNINERSLAVIKTSQGWDSEFASAATHYLTNSTQLINREQIRSVVVEELENLEWDPVTGFGEAK